MTRVIISTRDGTACSVECKDGISLMENIRAQGLDELLALCGGNCSCGTCHVHVDAAWLARLPAMAEDEHYLLDISQHREPTSRLSCQLVIEPGLDGLRARIAPEDL